ncbi:uncharacterized protein LOC125865921 [Solanum stenotomum]|uniref:uncharacterized protein LOC125865921 n=1 Tax=Solanum stenotomum TaxID=172797 RepID=UPI0020D1494E|nr:uncharacterized protein LOC125865921 [Solanum stenotomum]
MASYKQKLNVLREQLDILQTNLQTSNLDQSIIEQEKKILIDIEKWSNIEELVIRHKSRATWIDHGDSNTKYFHAQWKIRTSYNTISSIYNEAGNKLTEPNLIENEFISVFKGLMGTRASALTCLNTKVVRDGECLSIAQQRDLIKEVTTTEILEAIKEMPKDKAPGVDGYPIEFFTKNWDVVQNDVIIAVKNFFHTAICIILSMSQL